MSWRDHYEQLLRGSYWQWLAVVIVLSIIITTLSLLTRT